MAMPSSARVRDSVPSAASSSRAPQFAPVAQTQAGTLFARVDAFDRGVDDDDAGGARAPHALRLQHPPIDDRAQVRLADVGAVETDGSAASRLTRGIPNMHAFIAMDPVRRQRIPYAAFAQHPLRGAAQRKDP